MKHARTHTTTYSACWFVSSCSGSCGSRLSAVTLAPVCLGLMSTVMFHLSVLGVALSSLTPLFTRALKHKRTHNRHYTALLYTYLYAY